jgi:hypothetical protein
MSCLLRRRRRHRLRTALLRVLTVAAATLAVGAAADEPASVVAPPASAAALSDAAPGAGPAPPPAAADTAAPPGADVDDSGLAALLLPTDRGLRDDLAWLVDRRVLSLPLGTWPMPASLVRTQLRAARGRPWPAADADALERVEGALARSLAPARAGLRIDTARHPSLDGEASARGAARAHVAVQAHRTGWSARLQFDVLADSLSDPGREASLAGSYAALALPGTLLAAGVVDRWWGPGRTASPVLSNAAEPFPALLLRRAVDDAPSPRWLRWLGPWGYELSAGELLDYTPSRTRTIGMRVYARPLHGLEIGLGRHLLWAGAGRPSGWDALGDALTARSNVEQGSGREDPSDELAGIDLRYSHLDEAGRAWVAHAMTIGEDEADHSPTRRVTTAGLQLKLPWRDGRLEWSAEASDTRLGRMFGLGDDLDRAAYRHSVYVDGYYHGGLPLGAAIGGGGRLLVLGLDWLPACARECVRYSGAAYSGSVNEFGPQPINAAFSDHGRIHGLSLRRVATSRTLGLDWNVGVSLQRYRAGSRPDVGLQAGFELPIGGR